MQTRRGSRGVPVLIFDLASKFEWLHERCTPAALFWEGARYTGDWVGRRAVRTAEEKRKSLASSGIRMPNLPARSESLYRLSQHKHHENTCGNQFVYLYVKIRLN